MALVLKIRVSSSSQGEISSFLLTISGPGRRGGALANGLSSPLACPWLACHDFAPPGTRLSGNENVPSAPPRNLMLPCLCLQQTRPVWVEIDGATQLERGKTASENSIGSQRNRASSIFERYGQTTLVNKVNCQRAWTMDLRVDPSCRDASDNKPRNINMAKGNLCATAPFVRGSFFDGTARWKLGIRGPLCPCHLITKHPLPR